MSVDEVFDEISRDVKLLADNDYPQLKKLFEYSEEDFCDHWVIVLKAQALLREEIRRTRQEDLDAILAIR